MTRRVLPVGVSSAFAQALWGSASMRTTDEAGVEDLAARLDAIQARAASEGWPAWTEEDAHVMATAAADIRTIPEALAEGMKEAFTAGREYGHREERLDEIDRELVVLSRFLAQRAWGGGGAGWA